jgi:hypothetical protein
MPLVTRDNDKAIPVEKFLEEFGKSEDEKLHANFAKSLRMQNC